MASTESKKYITGLMNFGVIVLSIVLIVWISIDTFESQNLLQDYRYMHFQFWVCLFFVADFFIGLIFAQDKISYARRRIIFLLLSIPYVNIISWLNIDLSHDAAYFVRFIPLARGALAMSIVLGYLSSNPVSSMFLSYLSIIVLVTYFCSLIFYQRESGLNPEVHTYWTALWWSAMNMTTVGCEISPVTVAGKIIAVILPMCGMVIFPLFTVYLTDYVTRLVKRGRDNTPPKP
ncbi:MAG: two pore domain potassium channel family protein [Muribaculaceae bacterium]|nr:two pore domain potassium channel family protein [Muribaculaceae bacterium]